jgi:hypothetical protein
MFYDEPSNYLDQLPERLRGIVEIDAIAGSVDFEIDKLSAAVKKAVNNKFPSTADEDGCARWEKMLEISQVIDQFKNSSASGNPITVENLLAPVSMIKAKITGHTNQTVTKQGKNLFNPAAGTIIVNGVTCSVGEDGTITLDGTATEDVRITLTTALVSGTINPHVPIMILEQGKPYVFSETIISGTATGTWRHVIKDKDGDNLPDHGILDEGHSSLITAGTAQMDGASTSLYPGMVYLYAASGAVFDNFKYRIQFEQSESVTPWEQFVPDSPSPNYPAPITGTTALTVSDGGSNSQTINLPREMFDGDYYDFITGQGQAVKNKATLDGSQFISCDATYTNTAKFTFLPDDMADGSAIVSDRFKSISNSNADTEHIASWTGWNGINIFILKSRLSGWSDGNKNLWDIENGDGNTTISGIQFSIDSDKKITMSGTSTSDIYYNLTTHGSNGSGIHITAGTYTVSLSNPINEFGAAIYFAVKDINGNALVSTIALSHDGSTFTVSTDAYCTCYLNIPSGKTARVTVGFQLEEGSTATDYVNYLAPWTNEQKVFAFKSWLSSDPVTALYKLATPQEINGIGQSIAGYAPKTVISADSGAIDATMRSFDPNATLQAHRNAIRSKLMSKPPINLNTLKTIVEAYMGLEVDVTLDGYQVHIRYRGESRIADLNPLYATMWKTIPANMLVDIAYLYLTFDELDAQSLTFDGLDAKNLTVTDFEKGEWIA